MPWPLDQVDLDASIVTAVVADSGGLDIHRAGSALNQVNSGAFDAILELDPRDSATVPSLGNPEWIDPVNVRATIEPAPFHDGSILTAHDVVFSFDRVGLVAEYHQGGETTDHPGGWTSNATARGSGNWVRNEAIDDRTWAFEIPAPDAGFFVINLKGVSAVAIMSQADVEGRGDVSVDQSPMGTGPYRFVSHTDDEDFVYERFEEHFLPVDHPVRVPHYAHNKHLTGLVRPEVQSQLAGLQAGEIDMVVSLGPEVVEPFLDDPDFTVQFVPAEAWSTQNMYPNLFAETMDDGSPSPFLDVRVRWAANHAVNRQSLIDNLLLGVGEQSLVAFTGLQGYPTPEQKQEVTYAYDPERARTLLAEAGYPDGFDTPLYYTTGWGGSYIEDMVLTVAQDLTAAGIRAQPVSVQIGEYFTDAYTRGLENAKPGLIWFFGSPSPDIGLMWECCAGSDGFFSLSRPDPSLDELYAAQKVEQDPARRLEMITELVLEHARQAYYIFIVEPPDGVLTRSDVNFPRGGQKGLLDLHNTYAIQKRI